MPFTHVALFRAVNVGGYGLLSMADLRALLADTGLRDPKTLLQSGNAVFDGGRRSAGAIEKTVERELHARHGLASDVFVRSAAEWQAIVSSNPFTAEAAAAPSRLILMVLRDPPEGPAVKSLQRSIVGREQVRGVERQLYIVYPDGMGTSKLGGSAIEKALKTRGTARNWRTVLRIAAAFERGEA
jgi:uncharacterized protein (DUF1697 family)